MQIAETETEKLLMVKNIYIFQPSQHIPPGRWTVNDKNNIKYIIDSATF